MSVVGIMANIMANSDNDKAIENTKRANEIVERAKQLVEKAKAECQNSMICLDCEKREVLEDTLNTFSANFRRIAKTKKINFAAGSYLTEIGKFNENELGRMRTFTTQASSSSNKNNSLGSKIGGAVAKSALKKVNPVFGVFSTISSIASASEARQNLEEAKYNLKKANEYKDECESYSYKINSIKEMYDSFYKTIYFINEYHFKDAVNRMCGIIGRKKTLRYFFLKLARKKIYTDKEMSEILMAARLASLLGILMGTSILQENGNISEASKVTLEKVQAKLFEYTGTTDFSKTNDILVPVAGTVLRYTVTNGSNVNKNDTVMIIESMKMELEIKAVEAGIISFALQTGDKVQANQIVATVANTEASVDSAIEKHKALQIQVYKNPNSNKTSISSKQNKGSIYVPSKVAMVFGWLWCVFLAFWGLCGIIAGDFILCSIVIAAGLIVCPKINPHFKMKWKFFLSIILLLVGFFILGTSDEDSSINENELQTVQSQQDEESIPIPEAER